MNGNTPVVLLGVVGQVKELVNRVIDNPHKFAVNTCNISKDKRRYSVSTTEVSTGNYLNFRFTKVKGLPYSELTITSDQVDLTVKTSIDGSLPDKLDKMFNLLCSK